MHVSRLVVLLVVLLSGCGSSDSQTDTSKPVYPEGPITGSNLPIPDNSTRDAYNILLFGNSHIVGLASIINTLVSHTLPVKPMSMREASSQRYLDERLDDGVSLPLLQSEDWSHVILQAQKYSQSGAVDYSTVATQRWAQLSKEQQATPILFPEHPQRGRTKEGQRVYDLHAGIAALQAACVAPIGPVWDKVIALRPELELYHADGNHASALGKFLSALVFYQIITGQSADLLPYIASLDVEAEIQDFFGQIVSELILANPPCRQY